MIQCQSLSCVQLFATHMNCSPPGSCVCGIFQARILEWQTFPSPGELLTPGIEPGSPALQVDSLQSQLPGKPILSLSCVRLFATPWAIQSLEFSRPEYWNGQLFPSSGDLPNSGIEPRPPTLQADSLLAEPPGKPKNIGVGSLSLLQWIFLAWESNQGVLYCRQILYQLSYQGSAYISTHTTK